MPRWPRWPCPAVLPLPPLALQLQCRRGHGLTQRGLQPAAGLTSPHLPPVPGPRPWSHSRDRTPLQPGARGPLKPDAALKSVCGVWDGRLATSDPDSKADHEPVATVGPQRGEAPSPRWPEEEAAWSPQAAALPPSAVRPTDPSASARCPGCPPPRPCGHRSSGLSKQLSEQQKIPRAQNLIILGGRDLGWRRRRWAPREPRLWGRQRGLGAGGLRTPGGAWALAWPPPSHPSPQAVCVRLRPGLCPSPGCSSPVTWSCPPPWRPGLLLTAPRAAGKHLFTASLRD